MKAQQPRKNTIQLVALATTATPWTLQKSCSGISTVLQNIFSLQQLTAPPIVCGLISNIINHPQSFDLQNGFINCSAFNVPKRIPSNAFLGDNL